MHFADVANYAPPPVFLPAYHGTVNKTDWTVPNVDGLGRGAKKWPKSTNSNENYDAYSVLYTMKF